ncbi:hypothetical protein WMY93_006477 [Mugilogobius chulae]|uniref:V-type proton ATPase subunit a n=1 Tax=Mugilogobius chulae TaxID=88201 RepID=A0AAW0PK87_9GOBI
MFRSEDICLVQIFLQSGSAYNCISELGELGLVEFRDLNPDVNLFQRKFVNEIRRCEELEKRFVFLEQQLSRALPLSLDQVLRPPGSSPAPQPRDLLLMEEQSERLATQLSEVSTNRESLRRQLVQLKQYRAVLLQTHALIQTQIVPRPPCAPLDFSTLDDCDNHLSFVAGVVNPCKVAAFERLLWRVCKGYFIIDFQEMLEETETNEACEAAQWTIFLISFWGKTIGRKVKKICDCFHTNTFFYPESADDREELLDGLKNRIEDISKVLSQTESYLQQLLTQCVSVLPMWKVRVGKCRSIHSVLNLCSPSVTEKCLIAEAWCPTNKLLLLQSALIEGTRRSGSVVDSFYNRLPLSSSSSPPPTLFITNSFTSAFQSIVDAYGVAQYKEINPAVFTIVTFPFLFAVMFGDVGHGLLMAAAALWMILLKEENKTTQCKNEMWRLVYGGRFLILMMGLFSIYTGAIYNDCFSRGVSLFPSGWHLQAMNWSVETLKTNQILSLDPNTTGVFLGPYPLGIDPIWHLASNHLSFLNSYKMKMSVIIGVLHMTFGICLSYFNYSYRRQWSDVLLVLLPELVFMLGLFGYLVFMIFYKWVFFGPNQSDRAPSLLLHFINMILFTENKETQPLYHGQWYVQLILMILVLISVPVLLLGKPLYLLYRHRKPRQARSVSAAATDTSSINALLWELEGSGREQEQFDAVEVFMLQTIHTLEFCLGCVSNSASYLRLWALSLAHAQLSDVLWMMVLRISLSSRGMLGSVVLAVVFSFFALLTVSILLVMEGLSAFLHALRLHWVEFQSKFYSGTGDKFNPFSFSHILAQP